MITRNRSYRSVKLKTTTQSVPDRRINRRACVCLFFWSRSSTGRGLPLSSYQLHVICNLLIPNNLGSFRGNCSYLCFFVFFSKAFDRARVDVFFLLQSFMPHQANWLLTVALHILACRHESCVIRLLNLLIANNHYPQFQTVLSKLA